jgi:hypothetical protein
MGAPDRAYSSLVEAAAARPDHPRPRAEVAACLVQLGRHDEARAILEVTGSNATSDPSVRYARAGLLLATGREDDARTELAAAVAIRPVLGQYAAIDPTLGRLVEPGRTDGAAPAALVLSGASTI